MKPARDEILAEPAGERMDAWVAEYVMGWKRTFDGWLHDGCVWEPLNRNPSGDIAAAWQVVEKILSQHTQDIYFGWCIVPPGWRFGFSKKETHCFNDHGATGDTAPLAICRAAMLAVLDTGERGAK